MVAIYQTTESHNPDDCMVIFTAARPPPSNAGKFLTKTSIMPKNLKFITATVIVHFLLAYKLLQDLERCRWEQKPKLIILRGGKKELNRFLNI
jgi:hypothetical protein